MGHEALNGSLDENQGALYKFVKHDVSNPSTALSPVNISNGMAWNKNNTKLFYIDTPTLSIYQFNFDSKQGTISNKKVIFSFTTNNISGVPDGMTIDDKDNLWIAANGGGSIISVRYLK